MSGTVATNLCIFDEGLLHKYNWLVQQDNDNVNQMVESECHYKDISNDAKLNRIYFHVGLRAFFSMVSYSQSRTVGTNLRNFFETFLFKYSQLV